MNYRLQYSAELLRLPARHSRVPALPASSCGKGGEGCSVFRSLGLFHCAPWVISPSYLLKPFMLHYWLFLIKGIRVIFPSCQFGSCHSADYCDSVRWWKQPSRSWSLEVEKLTSQGNWFCLTWCLIFLPFWLCIVRIILLLLPQGNLPIIQWQQPVITPWFLSLRTLDLNFEDVFSSTGICLLYALGQSPSPLGIFWFCKWAQCPFCRTSLRISSVLGILAVH